MQSLRTEIGARITDARGNLVREIAPRPCHSLVKQFIQLLFTMMAYPATITIKDYLGVNFTYGANVYNLRIGATTATNAGILIGSGTTAVTMSDYKIATQLTTSIVHNAPTFAVETPDADTCRLAIARGFMNNTGAQVSVKEVALYAYFVASKRVCCDRTLYDVTFESGETLTLTYRISISL